MSSNKKHWTKLNSTDLFRGPFFALRFDEVKLFSGKIMPRYYVFEFSDWVQVIALTPENEIVLIRQYRHAVEDTMIEIPGGTVDPRHGETPEKAAARELLEETGYSFESLTLAGSCHPNPATQSNRLWTYVATGCRKTHEQELDPYEEIDVFTLPFAEFEKLMDQGDVSHALVLSSMRVARPVLKNLIG